MMGSYIELGHLDFGNHSTLTLEHVSRTQLRVPDACPLAFRRVLRLFLELTR